MGYKSPETRVQPRPERTSPCKRKTDIKFFNSYDQGSVNDERSGENGCRYGGAVSSTIGCVAFLALKVIAPQQILYAPIPYLDSAFLLVHFAFLDLIPYDSSLSRRAFSVIRGITAS